MGHSPLFGNHLSDGWKNRLPWSRLGLGVGDAGGSGGRLEWLGDLWTPVGGDRGECGSSSGVWRVKDSR